MFLQQEPLLELKRKKHSRCINNETAIEGSVRGETCGAPFLRLCLAQVCMQRVTYRCCLMCALAIKKGAPRGPFLKIALPCALFLGAIVLRVAAAAPCPAREGVIVRLARRACLFGALPPGWRRPSARDCACCLRACHASSTSASPPLFAIWDDAFALYRRMFYCEPSVFSNA